MGRIFSAEDLFAGEVPTRASFKDAERVVTEELKCPEILSVTVFGSTAVRTHGPRSDMDLLVIAEEGAGWRLHVGRLAHARARAAALHVPLQLIVLDELQALRPGHGIGPGLYAHIQAQGRRVVGEKDAWRFLPAVTEGALEEAAGYLGLKRNRLQQDTYSWKQMAQSERLRTLARALEGPVHLARKITHALTDIMHTDRGDLLEGFRTVADEHPEAGPAVDALSAVLETNRSYTEQIFSAPFQLRKHGQLLQAFKSTTGYESYLDALWITASKQAWEFYNTCDALFP